MTGVAMGPMEADNSPGLGIPLRSAVAVAVFLAVCCAMDFSVPLPGDGGRFPPRGFVPKFSFYVAAALLFFLSDAPSALDRRRLVRLVLPMVLAAAASAILPEGVIGRMFFLASSSGIALVLGRLAAQAGRSPGDLIGLFLMGASCDALICGFDIYACPVTAGPWTLRPPGLLDGAGPWASVPIPDLVFLGAFLEMSRRYGFHMASMVFGALAGFAGAVMLQTAAERFVPAIPIAGISVLIAAWPQIGARGKDIRRSLLATLAVCVALALMFAAKRLWIAPPQPLEPRIEDLRYSV